MGNPPDKFVATANSIIAKAMPKCKFLLLKKKVSLGAAFAQK
jgi:hypothetical protein